MGNHGKKWSISGTLLLRSEACDHYLCSKVVSVFGPEGIRLNVKSIQALTTVVIACIIYISNLANLSAVKAIFKKLCTETELFMMINRKHKAHKDTNFPKFQLSRRPAKEPNIPDKFKLNPFEPRRAPLFNFSKKQKCFLPYLSF